MLSMAEHEARVVEAERAYRIWRETRSISAAAKALGIPRQRVNQWQHRFGWVLRAAADGPPPEYHYARVCRRCGNEVVWSVFESKPGCPGCRTAGGRYYRSPEKIGSKGPDGPNHADGRTLEEVALALGISRERVRQLEQIAARKFRSAWIRIVGEEVRL